MSDAGRLSLAAAEALDRADPLAPLRARFELPADLVYLDGNSLGAPARGIAERVDAVMRAEWGRGLIRSWNGPPAAEVPWIDLPRRVAAKLAPLLGVEESEVAVADSTSVNLFKLLGAVLAARPQRRRLLAPRENFPSDLYVAAGVAESFAARLDVVPMAELASAIDDRTAVVTLSHVDFRSGELHDLPALAAAAHRCGALLLADLAHSAGTMPLPLAQWGVDLAVGCGYKFLGGGPGAPAFLVVLGALREELVPPLRGWLGHATPFAFAEGYRPAPGVDRFLCGTPPVLSLAALDAALDVFAGLDLPLVRDKVERLGDLLIARVDEELDAWDIEVVSPRQAARRGAHVSLRCPEAYAVVQALAARGVIGDFRAPDLVRLGLHPLTLGYRDVCAAVATLRLVLAQEEWRRPGHGERRTVT